MSRRTTLAERVEIIELSEAGLSDGQIVRQTGWSLSLVRKWRRRGRQQLVSVMGRPKRGSLSSFPEEMRETVSRWREGHPGWGEETMHSQMQNHAAFAEQKIPSTATVGRYLQEQALTRLYEKHSELPQHKQPLVSSAHQLWQMDAQGYQTVAGVGRVALINLNDVYSHVRLLSYPCWLGQQRVERHANTEDYQIALRLAFSDWGLPQCLQVDHESVYYDNHSQSPFPTRLHLWLLALGISLTFSRVHRPTDQAMTERSHQLWTTQVIEGQTFCDWYHLYHTLRQRRTFLNEQLPCRTLDNQPPLVAFPQAHHSGRLYRPEYEADLLDLQRVYDYLAQGRWYRLVSQVGTFSLGGYVYYLGHKFAKKYIVLTFDATDYHLICQDASGDILKRFHIQGISENILSGNLINAINLPHFQLELPFDWSTQRVLRLFEGVPVTT